MLNAEDLDEWLVAQAASSLCCAALIDSTSS
jgi:hypothetical protein